MSLRPLTPAEFAEPYETPQELRALEAEISEKANSGDLSGSFQALIDYEDEFFGETANWFKGTIYDQHGEFVAAHIAFTKFVSNNAAVADMLHSFAESSLGPLYERGLGLNNDDDSRYIFRYLTDLNQIQSEYNTNPLLRETNDLILTINTDLGFQSVPKIFENIRALTTRLQETPRDATTVSRDYVCMHMVYPALDAIEAACIDDSSKKAEAAHLLATQGLSFEKIPVQLEHRYNELLYVSAISRILDKDVLPVFKDIRARTQQARLKLKDAYLSGSYVLREGETEADILDTSFSNKTPKDLYSGMLSIDFDRESGGINAHMIVCLARINWDDAEKPTVAQFLVDGLAGHSLGTVPEVVKALQTIGPEHGIKPLMEAVRGEDVLQKRMAAEVLYRLEMGNSGVNTEREVRYFDQVYKLIQEQNPLFFETLFASGDAYVRRLDTSGSIGVFNGKDELLGRFQLDINSRAPLIEAPVYDVTSQQLFLPKADETPEQRKHRESMTATYLQGYTGLFDEVYKETGVKLNSLELYEQGWFIYAYASAPEAERARIHNLLKNYSEAGLHAFLALDYGESSEAILDYAESSRFDTKKLEVMQGFNSLAASAYEWRQAFEQIQEGIPVQFAAQAHEALVRKGSEYFRAALKVERGEGGDVSMAEVLDSMRQIDYALNVLRVLYKSDSNLIVEQVQSPHEFADAGFTTKLAKARTTWTISDPATGTKITTSVRPQRTYQNGTQPGGEARINFAVSNKSANVDARIGIDLAENSGETHVSLDLGTGLPFKKSGVYPSERVSRVLSLVEGSQGGHNEASFDVQSADFTEVATRFRAYMDKRFSSKS